MKNLVIATVGAIVLSLNASPAWSQTAPDVLKTPPAPVAIDEGLIALLAKFDQQVEQRDQDGARKTLEEIFNAKTLPQLPAPVLQAVYRAQGDLSRDWRVAHTAYVKVTELPNPTGRDWAARLETARALKDKADMTACLVALARNHPEILSGMEEREFFENIRLIKEADVGGDRHFQIASTLHETSFARTSPFETLEHIWLAHALALVERNRPNDARVMIAKLQLPSSLVLIRADKRFDAVAQISQQDVEDSAKRMAEKFRTLQEQQPDKLQSVYLRGHYMLTLGQYEEALALTNDALKKAQPSGGRSSPYVDGDKFLNWIMEIRFRALRKLDRRDDAVAQMLRAIKVPESGQINVSQQLNLANYYNRIGQPRDALVVLADVPSQRMSGYGRMVREIAATCAYAQLGQTADMKKALGYIKEHVSDGPGALEDALTCARDSDGLAASYVSRLKDPATRNEQLRAFQTYELEDASPEALGRSPRAVADDNFIREVQARPEVQSALAEVGRAYTYRLGSAP